ncbi:VC0807 family protein [Streptomyces sp. NPDC005279]|uniref:VC0807 family protein n=1 Tax=Streptomyces sp. NPDC005279 TaxID=3364712 RepID=UPI003678B91A
MAESGRRGSVLRTWGPTMLFGVLLPWITYGMLTDHGIDEVPALLLISCWPLVELAIYFAMHRRVDEFGVMILITLLLGAVSALAFNSAKLLFLKDSALTGLLGLAFLVSLTLKRPLIFYFGRKFGTDGTPEGVADWNAMWHKYPGFRTAQRRLTIVWGVAFLVEAGVKAGLVYVLDTETMVGVSNVLPFVFLAGLMVYTIRAGKKGRARREAAEAAAAEAAAAEAAAAEAETAAQAPA